MNDLQITAALGTHVPVITNYPDGIIGKGAISDKIYEVEWYFRPDEVDSVMLIVGFLPGLKVTIISLLKQIQLLFAGEADDDDLSENFIVKTCQRCIPVTCNNEANESMEAGVCDWFELGSFLWLFLLSLGLVVFQSGSFQVSFGVVCFGPGSCPDKCVTWARGLVDEEDDQFLVHSFIAPVFSVGHHQVEFLTREYRTHHLGMATISYLSSHVI
ncbi:hypothetical protein Hdeb2414_s0182g00825811 [Helianthus debilis subsp. tardiflorus]